VLASCVGDVITTKHTEVIISAARTGAHLNLWRLLSLYCSWRMDNQGAVCEEMCVAFVHASVNQIISLRRCRNN